MVDFSVTIFVFYMVADSNKKKLSQLLDQAMEIIDNKRETVSGPVSFREFKIMNKQIEKKNMLQI